MAYSSHKIYSNIYEVLYRSILLLAIYFLTKGFFFCTQYQFLSTKNTFSGSGSTGLTSWDIGCLKLDIKFVKQHLDAALDEN